MTSTDPALLEGVRLARTLGPHLSRLLARQGLISFADVAARADAELLAVHGIGAGRLRRLRRLTAIVSTKGQLPRDVRSTHPWDYLETDDPGVDLLIAADLLDADQQAALDAVSIHAAGLDQDTLTNTLIFGCRTLLDAAHLPPARIACLTPKAFADLRAHLQMALERRLPVVEAEPVPAPRTDRPRRRPLPETLTIPAGLRESLKDIPLAVLTLPDAAFGLMQFEGITDPHALMRRDPGAISARYGLSAADLAALKDSLRRMLLRSAAKALVHAILHGSSTITPWLDPIATESRRPWIALDVRARRQLTHRPVAIGQAGLSARASGWLIAGGITTLAAVAEAPAERIAALFATEPAALTPLRHRIESLARYAGPQSGPGDQDIDCLQQDGFGPDLCEALAFAGWPTLGLAARADLKALAGIPAEIVPSLERAIRARLSAADDHRPAQTLLDLEPDALAWLRAQPIAALDAPRLRKGVVHRLRQAGFSDLAALASADRATLPRMPSLGDQGADLIAARITAILAETPYGQNLRQAKAA